MAMQHLINYDALHARTLKDSMGNGYGTVKDIIVDKDTGSILFLVISKGGVLGTELGSDHYVVPFMAVDITPNTGELIMNVNKEQIKKSPKLDHVKVNKWTEEEIRDVFTYYGIKSAQREDKYRGIGGRDPNLSDKKHDDYEGSYQISDRPHEEQHKPGDHLDYDKMNRKDRPGY